MRTITKTVTLPVGDQNMDFRLTKLDAFSGAALLKLIAHAETEDLQELLLSLPEAEMEALMRTCLRSVHALLPAGPARVLENGCWGVAELEYDGWTCLRLTLEMIRWTMEGFFPGSAPAS